MSLIRVTLGDVVADQMADAMGRQIDTALFYGTQPIQENDMNADRITEVSATVDAGLSQEDLDGMNEAERLALIVGAAYGKALAERDEARAQVAALAQDLADLGSAAQAVLALDVLAQVTWAHDEQAVQTLRQAVGSVQAPETQED